MVAREGGRGANGRSVFRLLPGGTIHTYVGEGTDDELGPVTGRTQTVAVGRLQHTCVVQRTRGEESGDHGIPEHARARA